MESFPKKELPVALGQALWESYQDETPGLPEWAKELFGHGEGRPPERQLTPEERAHGLAVIWSEAKYNFAYWDLLPGEAWWDEQFRTFLPRAMAPQTDEQYYHLLKRFARLLRDGHTGVILPPYMQKALGAPPLWVRPVEGRPVVVDGDPLPRGTLILAVDGRLAGELIAEGTETVEASTDHFAEYLTAARILRGPLGTTALVRVRLPGGAVREVTVERGPLPQRPPLVVRDLGEGIRHVQINTMADPKVPEQFDEAFPDFAGVRGLILDVRFNGGGSSAVGCRILARVLQRPALASAVRMRTYMPTIRAWGMSQRWWVSPAREIQPDDQRPRFQGPVAFLSSPLTYSAAEDFLVVCRSSGRGPIIGEPSGGSTGQPLLVPLPGGGAFRVCTKRDTHPDGSLFVGSGVQPDIPCSPTLSGVAEGRDEILERAVRYVREQAARFDTSE